MRALVVCFRKVQQLTVKLFGPSALSRGVEGVHGGAVKPSEAANEA